MELDLRALRALAEADRNDAVFDVSWSPEEALALLDEIERLHGASDTEIALRAENKRLLDEIERKDRAGREIVGAVDHLVTMFEGESEPEWRDDAMNALLAASRKVNAALSPATPREEMSNDSK